MPIALKLSKFFKQILQFISSFFQLHEFNEKMLTAMTHYLSWIFIGDLRKFIDEFINLSMSKPISLLKIPKILKNLQKNLSWTINEGFHSTEEFLLK